MQLEQFMLNDLIMLSSVLLLFLQTLPLYYPGPGTGNR
jgi:hypothetical protein